MAVEQGIPLKAHRLGLLRLASACLGLARRASTASAAEMRHVELSAS